jgi:ascorbate-specific PTS system EIIC-type component UlaA
VKREKSAKIVSLRSTKIGFLLLCVEAKQLKSEAKRLQNKAKQAKRN